MDSSKQDCGTTFYRVVGLQADRSMICGFKIDSWCIEQCFGPLALYDVAGFEEVPEGTASLENRVEAEMVLCLYRQLITHYPQLRSGPHIGIISPYSAQVPSQYCPPGAVCK